MRITPIFTPIRFTSSHPNPPQSPYRKNELDDNSFLDSGSRKANTIMGALAGISIGILATAVSEISHDRKFAAQVIDTFEAEDVKKDSLIIADITGDENPDIILLKNDGSQVIVDLFEQKIIDNDSELE